MLSLVNKLNQLTRLKIQDKQNVKESQGRNNLSVSGSFFGAIYRRGCSLTNFTILKGFIMNAATLTTKINEFTSVYTELDQHEKAIKAIDRVITHRHNNDCALFIIGDTGVGKSRLVEHYLQRMGELERCETKNGITRNILRAICVEVGFERGLDSLLSAILEKLGDINPYRRSTLGEKKDRAIKLLKYREVEVIFMDEIHNIDKRQTKKNSEGALSFLKTFLNQANTAFVLLGVSDAENLRLTDDELNSRCKANVYLNNYDCCGEDNTIEFIEYLLDILEELPVPIPYLACVFDSFEEEGGGYVNYDTHKQDYDNLFRFCMATKGNPKLIRRLLVAAMEVPSTKGINKEQLAEAWEFELGEKTVKNPFEQHIKSLFKAMVKEELYV
ncbi:MAG: hypothetical protein ACI87J_000143 [Colwellia sp.]|jgi:hypothetical protein